MDDFLKRANEADGLLEALTARVAALEKGQGGSGGVQPGFISFDPKKPGMTPVTKAKLEGLMGKLRKDIGAKEKRIADQEKRIAKLEKENANLKKQLKNKGKGGANKGSDKLQKQVQQAQSQADLANKTIEKLTVWRAEVEALAKERDELKAQVSGAKGSSMSQGQVDMFRTSLQEMRKEVVAYLQSKGDLEAEVANAGAVSSGPTRVQMTMDTIKERKVYFITQDLAQLKREWEEAELGPLDDEDFQGYLGREVKSIDVEEDDDTVNVRFDSHDTQWFPVTCLFEEVEGAAPVQTGPVRVQMSMDTIKERKYYFVEGDINKLKREWEEAELGPLDDEDFETYLNRKVYAIDLEEDDDTMNVRFDNHDTQWFPVTCLYQEVEGVAVKAAPTFNANKTQMNMDTIKERKKYFVTEDIVQLKKEWEEAELGPLDDEDFQGYLGREVFAIDLEEDDDTMNVRFDNHDTQWFPVTCLYKAGGSAPAQPQKPKRTKQSMDSIKERKYYYVTEDLAELKRDWEAAELGPLDDEDFQSYLGRKVFAIDLEEDDDTMNVRFDNHDTQWFPVTCLYKGDE